MTVQHYKITAPEALFSGVVAGVSFHQGVATVSVDPDAPRPEGETRAPKELTALAYFRRKGYLVEEVDQKEAAEAVREAVTTTPGTPNTRAVDPGQAAGDSGEKTTSRRSPSNTSKEAK